MCIKSTPRILRKELGHEQANYINRLVSCPARKLDGRWGTCIRSVYRPLAIDFIFVPGDVFDADYNNLTVTVNKAVVAVEAAECAHDWAAADCDTAKTCKVCGATEGAAVCGVVVVCNKKKFIV